MKEHHIKINIINDLNVGCTLFIKINGQEFTMCLNEKEKCYEIESTSGDVEISIQKENVWKSRSKAVIFLFTLFDMIMGIAVGTGPQTEVSENMPFEIDYSLSTTVKEDTIFNYKLSELIHIDDENIIEWEKLISLETGILFVLIACILGIIGFIIKGFIGVLIMCAALPVAGIIAFSARSNILKIMDKLRSEFIW